MRAHCRATTARLAFVLSLALGVMLPRLRAVAQALPDRLADADFWQMMTGFSEPSGYFRSENLLSNETGFENVIPELLRTARQGTVYVGVGPEQNFTYIAALHPAMVFVVDIRHQNAMQHLLYKALFEMSDNRADFLSRLFSRPLPRGIDRDAPIDTLFAALEAATPDSVLFERTLGAVTDRLVNRHGFALDSLERQLIAHNFSAFFEAGPDLSYNFNSSFNAGGYGGRGRMPTYAALMQVTDSAGQERSYLANEANFAAVRDLELRNLIVPLTGDFGGPRALRAVGDYVRAHGAIVGAFYASNVEQYLFQEGDAWSRFYANVSTMPLDSTSTFIRSGGGGFRGPGGMRSSLLESMQGLLAAFHAGQISSYADVIGLSH